MIDTKFVIHAACREHQPAHLHDHHDAVLFLAKDKALPATLRAYREECVRLGADRRQLAGIDNLIARVYEWQEQHADRLKVADIDDSERGRKILAGEIPTA